MMHRSDKGEQARWLHPLTGALLLPGGRRRARAAREVDRGRALLASGEPRRAVSCLQEALSLDPSLPPEALVSLARALLEAEQPAAARRMFERVRNLQPSSFEGYAGYAKACEAMGEWLAAAAAWESCIQAFPDTDRPEWPCALGKALGELGAFERAAEVLAQVVARWPDRPLGHVTLAANAERAGRPIDALRRWEHCLAAFPEQVQPDWHTARERLLIALGRSREAGAVSLRAHGGAAAARYLEVLEASGRQAPGQPLNFQSILVITYGRTGSTLLQGILNTIDGVLVRGENGNLFAHFFEAYQTLRQISRTRPTAILPNQPWFGAGLFDRGAFMAGLRETARTLLLADRIDDQAVSCYGFKEIRYIDMDERLPEYLDFLRELFPNPAFIFNSRNVDDVLQSAWWAERDSADWRQRIQAFEAQCSEYARTHDNCFQTRFEAFKQPGEPLEALFRFLGAELHPERIEAVLATPHSFNPRQASTRALFEAF